LTQVLEIFRKEKLYVNLNDIFYHFLGFVTRNEVPEDLDKIKAIKIGLLM